MLITKHGISAPASHPLRAAVERHKARLSSELARVRIRRGFATLEEFRVNVKENPGTIKGEGTVGDHTATGCRPRWIRVNTLKTSLSEQLATTFVDFQRIDRLQDMVNASATPQSRKLIFLDKHVPNLLAIQSAIHLKEEPAYLRGQLVLQDKASCFPAYLLDPEADGPCLDACAAPGNKTTHLAAILAGKTSQSFMTGPLVYACERDAERSDVLKTMVTKLGAGNLVEVRARQDFLRLDPTIKPWNHVHTLLLDPSCSGNGIIGRDDSTPLKLPLSSELQRPNPPKKRKRPSAKPKSGNVLEGQPEPLLDRGAMRSTSIGARLSALSTFQLKLILHAFAFPSAQRITYSTCSMFEEENEHVVFRALSHSQKQALGWRILERKEQISGLQSWPIRGYDCSVPESLEMTGRDVNMVKEACIRCEKNTVEGTQGFFVAAFVRQKVRDETNDGDDDWAGFSDQSDPE